MTAVGEALCLLLVGHALGDFYSQSDKLASEKERSRTAMLHHCVLYAIGMAVAIAVLAYGLQCNLRAAALWGWGRLRYMLGAECCCLRAFKIPMLIMAIAAMAMPSATKS